MAPVPGQGRAWRAPGKIFSIFGKKLTRFSGPQGPTFVSNGPGLREVGSARPRAARFQRKVGAYGMFFSLCGLKCCENVTNFTKK